jgi:sec-independent protein translocase protein TatC
MSDPKDKTTEEHDGKEQPLVSHLMELRDRILRCVVAILIVFVGLYAWRNDIYMFVVQPLTRLLGEGETIISTTVGGTFFAPFKLTFMTAVFVTMPFLLHQAWAFISPGLYRNEIRVTFPILLSSIVLFYFGIAFCYYVVFEFIFDFFIKAGPADVAVMNDINEVLNFVLKLFFSFGIIFEIPVATVLLVMSGVTTPKDLVAKRGYIVIGCFALAIPLTPPDPMSQSMLAVPMWLLFEIGVLASRLMYKPDPEDEEAADSTAAGK